MENKMHIWIMKPIRFMSKGERGYSSANNFVFVYKGDSFENIEVFIYIYKSSGYISFIAEGNYFEIEKYGDEITDFKIILPQNIHYAIISIEDIKESDFFSPIKIDFSFSTEEDSKKRAQDLSLLSFEDLLSLVWFYAENGNFKQYKDKLNEILKYIPNTLRIVIQNYDEEGLLELKGVYKKYEDEALEDLPEGEKKKFLQRMYRKIQNTVDQVAKDLQERSIRNFEIEKDLQERSIHELNQKLTEAVSNSNFELAAKIRDLIKDKEES